MTDQQVTKRLDRLEIKIDKICDVLTSLARVEEQIKGQNARLKRHETLIKDTDEKVEELTETVTNNAAVARTAEKIFFSVLASLAAFITWLIQG